MKNQNGQKNGRKNSMSTGFPLLIGVVIAAVCTTQENWGGAGFAVVVGGAVSLWMLRSSRRK
ncbi:hypothetical protein [Streptomyces sp. NPDC059009]|uniref:hypothetical protein n=1 Tax=Streptomyces sp. NPDC059009 TaxID=3346694 RepID=UPI00368157B5